MSLAIGYVAFIIYMFRRSKEIKAEGGPKPMWVGAFLIGLGFILWAIIGVYLKSKH